MGIERVRFRRPVHPGDVVEIEAVVERLRSRMGVLSGAARVNGTRRLRRHDDVRAGAEDGSESGVGGGLEHSTRLAVT